ncbi:unnamed protein product [Vicia faba]|uniref:Uncharacterized protein n=1 Tax=Vicia faba TaxID=3906 RepID=A0AAV0YUC6_VICFA|nr:unnamed protein product [Vicia faba]
MVNTRTSFSAHVLKLDHIADVVTTLMIREPTSSLASTKKTREVKQQSPWTKASPRLTRIIEDGSFREVTAFINIPDILFSWLLGTPEEVASIVSMLDLSFVKNILEGDKMELASQLAHSMFKVGSIFLLSLLGGVISWPQLVFFKERDTCKDKVEAIEMK